MVSVSDFKKVQLEDAEEFSRHFGNYPAEHSDYMFSTMISWAHYMTYRFTFIRDSLVIMTEREGERHIRPPVGPPDNEALEEVLELSRDLGSDPPLSMVTPSAKILIEENHPRMEFLPHRDYFEYVYLSRRLAELPGKRYLKIRNYLNKFRRENDHVIEPLTGENQKEALEFLDRWCEQKGCEEEPFLMEERKATYFALGHLEELGLKGLVIRIDDRIEAFSIFEQMEGDTAVVHYEKANYDIKGSYEAINNETSRFISPEHRFINRESDMGEPGLRKAKQKYGPHHMLEVYHVHTDSIG